MRKVIFFLSCLILTSTHCLTQDWKSVKEEFGTLPKGVEIFTYSGQFVGRPFIAYLVRVELSANHLEFLTDTTYTRRFTPSQYYQRNQHPFLVVNGTFFDFATNRNLNVVVRNRKMVSFNQHSQPVKSADSAVYLHSSRSAIGINRQNKADIAWLFTDSSYRFPYAFQQKPILWRDDNRSIQLDQMEKQYLQKARKWKMQTAIGGGPVLIQAGKVNITNDEEKMFAGNARFDLHPRTAMGYTAEGKLIILAVEGRHPLKAEGASLVDLANILHEFGCVEALNLDGGGSSCLLINGKETIQPSDKEGQRAVPAVFMVRSKK